MSAVREMHDSRETPGRQDGGLFCVVEGIDGSGKSTLLELLHTVLADGGLQRRFGRRFRALRKLREPTTGPVGRRIRAHLQAGDRLADEEWLRLFFEDRAENVSENIGPALQEHELILQDRYFYSTAAYQAPSPEESALIVQRSLDAGFPEPDVVLYLAIEPETAIARIHSRLQEGATGEPASGEPASDEKKNDRKLRNSRTAHPHSSQLQSDFAAARPAARRGTIAGATVRNRAGASRSGGGYVKLPRTRNTHLVAIINLHTGQGRTP